MPQKHTIEIGGTKIRLGQRVRLDLEIPALFDNAPMNIPLEVIRGTKAGPTLFVCAAIHGDEVNGTEGCHRLLRSSVLKNIKGTLIVAPIVNIYGFNNKSRYLPDRRDLNRCFPGNERGSLGSRLAYILMQEVVLKCTHVIDIHTGAIHRTNISQIRSNFHGKGGKAMRQLASSFGVPVLVHSSLRDGSFREAVRDHGIPMLLFEGGQALRFEENVIKTITKGVINTMKAIGMLESTGKPAPERLLANKTSWIRASHSGIFKMKKRLGSVVKEGEVVATITGPLGETLASVMTPYDGVILGATLMPLVMAGEGLFNIGLFDDFDIIEEVLEMYEF
jgi:uncharacterized protein